MNRAVLGLSVSSRWWAGDFATGCCGRKQPCIMRWFFARKPDAGFVLTDFPATLLQARVFDEWLETRDENLDAVFAGPGSCGPVIEHYRTLGLLTEASIPATA